MKTDVVMRHAVTILGNMIHKVVRTIASKKVESTLLFKSKNALPILNRQQFMEKWCHAHLTFARS